MFSKYSIKSNVFVKIAISLTKFTGPTLVITHWLKVDLIAFHL